MTTVQQHAASRRATEARRNSLYFFVVFVAVMLAGYTWYAVLRTEPALPTPEALASMIAESDRLAAAERETARQLDQARGRDMDAGVASYRQREKIENAGYIVEWDYPNKQIKRVYVRGELVYKR